MNEKIANESRINPNRVYNCADIASISKEVIRGVKDKKVETEDVMKVIKKRPPSLKDADFKTYKENLEFFKENYSSLQSFNS